MVFYRFLVFVFAGHGFLISEGFAVKQAAGQEKLRFRQQRIALTKLARPPRMNPIKNPYS